nr:hypothetical protein Iba_scaffold33483CG0010 [Ipomoea batatas]
MSGVLRRCSRRRNRGAELVASSPAGRTEEVLCEAGKGFAVGGLRL